MAVGELFVDGGDRFATDLRVAGAMSVGDPHALDVFQWRCRVHAGTAEAVSTGLRDDRGLADLVEDTTLRSASGLSPADSPRFEANARRSFGRWGRSHRSRRSRQGHSPYPSKPGCRSWSQKKDWKRE